MFENRVLRETFGPKRDEVTMENGEECIMKSLLNYTKSKVKVSRDRWP